MAASDNFKQQLKAGKIIEALQTALSEVIELEITTWVSSAETDISAEESSPGSRMQSRINIVDGDITNEVGSQFLSYGPYHELQQFHLEQVRQGRETIQNNLKSIQKLFGILAKIQNPHSQPSELSGVENLPLPPGDNFTASEVTTPEESAPEMPTPVPTPQPSAESSGGMIPLEEPVVESPAPPDPVNVSSSVVIMPEVSEVESPILPLPPDPPAEPNAESNPVPISLIVIDSSLETPVSTPLPSKESEPTAEVISPETPAPNTDASEWEDDQDWGDVGAEKPNPKAPTPTQLGWGVNWGTDEEWEDVETDEPETFIGLPMTTPGSPEWQDDDWGDDDLEEPTPTETDVSPNNEISNAMAVLFGDSQPVESPPSPTILDEPSSPINIEEALFSKDDSSEGSLRDAHTHEANWEASSQSPSSEEKKPNTKQ